MSPETPSAPGSPAPAAALPSPRPGKSRWFLYGCGTILVLILLIVATIAITLWWIQRPIKPVVLSAAEKATVEQKLQQLSGGNTTVPASSSTVTANLRGAATNRGPVAAPTPRVSGAGAEMQPGQGGQYVPGSKVLKLTDREINGLLNANTDLGKSVKIEFAQDAVNMYVAVRIPEDFPVGGGKMFRARARFLLSLGKGGEPYAILEDVTVFGLSLPKAWLGGLKGENLIERAMGEHSGSPVFRGVKSLRVEPGALVLEVND